MGGDWKSTATIKKKLILSLILIKINMKLKLMQKRRTEENKRTRSTDCKTKSRFSFGENFEQVKGANPTVIVENEKPIKYQSILDFNGSYD